MGSDTNLSTPGFLSPDAYYAMHRNPRKIIFARHNSLNIKVPHPLHNVIVLQQKISKDHVLIHVDLRIQYKSNNERTSKVHLFHRQCLTLGGGPSFRRRLAIHHLHTGTLLHSLAI